METYLFYDSTGAIVRMQSYSFVPDSSLVAANTPTGQTALLAPAGHDSLSHPQSWQVVNGELQEIVPTAAQQLTVAQTSQNEIIAAAYQAAITSPCSYMGTSFWCDKDSQTILAHSLVVFNQAGAVPANFYYLDANGNDISMSLTQLQGLGSAVATQYLGAFQKRVSLQRQIAAATTIEAVQAIVW